MAIPQYAMAQSGSVLAISMKALSDCGYQKLCRMATARLNAGCTSALQETGKLTLPSFSSSWAAARPDANNSVMNTATKIFPGFMALSCMSGPMALAYAEHRSTEDSL